MNLFLIVLQSVMAIIGIGVVGFWILRRGIIPEQLISFLSRLAIDVALPCVVFAGIVLNFDPKIIPDWWQLPLWWIAFECFAFLFVLISMFVSQKKTRSEFAMSLFYQNGLFFPLIIIAGLFGEGSIYGVQLFVFIIFYPLFFFTTSYLFFPKRSEQNRKRKLNLARIINPVIIATALALGVRQMGLEAYVPSFIVKMFAMIGAMTLPLLMIILGGSLYIDFRKKGRIYYKEAIKFVIVKNIIFPLVFIGLLVLIRPEYGIALIIFFQSAVPPITGTSVLAEREGGNTSISNQFILASFVTSIITIPLMFLLFSRYFPVS